MNMRLRSIISRVNGLAAVAVKPFGFRLTKTQLAITFVVIRASSPFHVALSHRNQRITVIDKIDIL